MKYRQGYVSNSSSSSFIVFEEGLGVLDNERLAYAKVSKETANKIRERLNIPSSQELYVTEFISDTYGSGVNDIEHYDYVDGNHMGPYDEDAFEEIDTNVWVLKEDLEDNLDLKIYKVHWYYEENQLPLLSSALVVANSESNALKTDPSGGILTSEEIEEVFVAKDAELISSYDGDQFSGYILMSNMEVET